MKICSLICLFVLFALRHQQAAAQSTNSTNSTCQFLGGPPDVNLTVPKLSVAEIQLIVSNLDVKLNLNAQVSDLIQLSAGVEASIKTVNLTILNVSAEVDLLVRLDNVRCILNEVVDTLDAAPQILTDTVASVGNILNTLLSSLAALPNVLSAILGGSNNVIVTLIDDLGNLVQQILSASGSLLSSSNLGSLTSATGVTPLKIVTQNGKNVERYLHRDSNAVVDCVKEGTLLSGCRVVSKPIATTSASLFQN